MTGSVATAASRLATDRLGLILAAATISAFELAELPLYHEHRLTLAATLLALGIPHGAIDAWLARRALGVRARWLYPTYLLALAGAALLWWLSPTAALAAFLIASAYHFGESELVAIAWRPGRRAVAYLTRGLAIIALPIGLHLEEVAPILARMGVEPTSTLGPFVFMVGAVSMALHALLLAASPSRRLARRAAEPLLILTPLFVVAHPLVSFAMYFTLVHARVHWRDMQQRFLPRGTWRALLPHAWTHSLAAFAGIGLALFALPSVDADTAWAVLFVALAAVTFPHMAVVAAIHRCEDTSSATSP